jgi:hypothetical protein
VELATPFAQQRSVGDVVNERVFEHANS